MRAWARRTALLQLDAGARERCLHFGARLRGGRHHFVYATGRIEEILVDELILRIERSVAVGQDAIADSEDVRILAEDFLDLLVAPDIEGTLHLVRRWIGGLLGRNAVGILR